MPSLALVAVIVSAIAPRSTPFMLVFLGGGIVALGVIKARAISLRPLPGLVLALIALGAYLALNALWSVAPLMALGRVVLFALIVALGLAVGRTLPELAREASARPYGGLL
jgi:hypothetical protein